MPRKDGNRPAQAPTRSDRDLLNFQLPQRPKHVGVPARQREGHSKKKTSYEKPKRKTGLFPLHCSPDHAFVITRQPYHGGEGQYSFRGSDDVVSWESVRIVKYLTPCTLECPICLGSFQCARITKCGHCFCLTCLIHHVQSTSDLSYQAPKCPCCGIPVHLTDTRAVQMVLTSNPVRRFVKLHRVKTCPAPYLPHMDQPRRGAGHAAPTMNDADSPYCRFNYINVNLYQELLQSNLQELGSEQGGTMMEDLCQALAMQMIQDDIAKAMAEAAVEKSLAEQYMRPVSGVAMEQPLCLVAKEDQTAMRRERADSIVSTGESHYSGSTAVSNHMSAKYGGSMYLDESEDFVFYQAEDGSLCFLSGFNMKCLQTEFAVGPSVAVAMDQMGFIEDSHQCFEMTKAPLPDFVEGRIIEIERVQLTRELRERRRFLSHLPLFTEISFVEIGIGHILSKNTKKIFKKEFYQRTMKRAAKSQSEQRADAKLKRREAERVNELKARYQGIDPTDEFFWAPVNEPPLAFSDEGFGPCVGSNSTYQSPPPVPSLPFSFSQVIRSGEAFPNLKAANTEANFPSLSAAVLPTTQTTQGWGGRVAKKAMASPINATSVAASPKMTPLIPNRKKGTKPK